MRKFFFTSIIGLGLMTGCNYTDTSEQVAAGSQVGGTGGIKYTVENLTSTKYFLAVTAAPGLGETEGSIAQRIHQFAMRFAATQCPEDYAFLDDPNMAQPYAGGFMRRTRSYVFQCK